MDTIGFWDFFCDTGSYFRTSIQRNTYKELVKRWKPSLCSGVVKKNTHKALDDIRESIEELKYYREHFIIK